MKGGAKRQEGGLGGDREGLSPPSANRGRNQRTWARLTLRRCSWVQTVAAENLRILKHQMGGLWLCFLRRQMRRSQPLRKSAFSPPVSPHTKKRLKGEDEWSADKGQKQMSPPPPPAHRLCGCNAAPCKLQLDVPTAWAEMRGTRLRQQPRKRRASPRYSFR